MPSRGRGRPPKELKPSEIKGPLEMEREKSGVKDPVIKVNPVYTSEDAALDRELMALEREEPTLSDDEPAIMGVKQTVETFLTLREYIEENGHEYKPADTISELRDQVFYAKSYGCEAIEATKRVILYFCQKQMPKVGYFIYDSVRVYWDGYDGPSILDEKNQTIDEKLFPKAKK